MRDFLKEAANRWKTDLPPFFKRLRAFGLSLATLGATILAPETFGLDISIYPSFLLELAKDIAAVGVAIAAVSQFAQQNVNGTDDKN